VKSPFRGFLHFCRAGLGFRTLFDQGSGAAASWRGGSEADDPIPIREAASEDAKRPSHPLRQKQEGSFMGPFVLHSPSWPNLAY